MPITKDTAWPALTAEDPGGRAAEIVAVDCFPLHLPMKKALTTASHGTSLGQVLYVRVRTRGGAEGWGEAGIDPAMSGETLPGMVAAVETHLRPRLVGRSAFDRVMLARELQHHLYGNGGPKAAIDMALLDVLGHILGVRTVELLGGMTRRSARVLRLVGGSGDTAEDVAEAEGLADDGFHAFKLKVGVVSLEREAGTMRALRERLGPDVLIAADANMAWTTAEARRFCRLSAPADAAFLEQPVVAGDTARLAQVAHGSEIPIGADEALHGLHDIMALAEAGAIQGVSLKTIKLGGLTLLLDAGRVAHAIGLSVNLAMLVESSLASTAMIHAACAVPQVDWGLSLGCLLLADEPIERPFRCEKGHVACPIGPGLGVSVDETRLARFAPA